MIATFLLVMFALLVVLSVRAYLEIKARQCFQRKADEPYVQIHPPDTELSRMAVHEVGHVVCAWACTAVGEVEGATISDAGGLTKYTLSTAAGVDEQWCRMVILLAGAAGEAMIYKTWRSMPACTDLRSARECACALVRMGSSAPPWPSDKPASIPLEKAFSDRMTPPELDVMKRGYAEARRIVRAHGGSYYRLVALLLSAGRLTESDIQLHLPSRGILRTLNGSRFVV